MAAASALISTDSSTTSSFLPASVILESNDTFIKGLPSPVCLTNDAFIYGRECIQLNDVIGCKFRQLKDTNRSFFEVYAYPKRSSSGICCTGNHSKNNPRYANHILVEVRMDKELEETGNNNMTIAKQWAECISNTIYPTGIKNYLIFVNPVGGPGIAETLFNTIVEPMLIQSGHKYTLVITQRADHAKDYVAESNNLDEYTALVAIGGDGMLYEIVQGMASRPDYLALFRSLPLGIINGGSGNGLAKSVMHESFELYGVLPATFVILRGEARELDMSKVYTPGVEKPLLSFLCNGWALLSDIDIESERLRCLGASRFTVGFIVRLVFLRSYPAKFSFKPTTEQGVIRSVTPLPSLDEPVPEDWVTIEDDFTMIWICQSSYASHDLYNNPGAGLTNGKFTIFVMRAAMSRVNIARFFLLAETGEHLDTPQLETYKATAYRLEPQTERGLYSLDGEVIPYGPVQANIEAGFARIISLPFGGLNQEV